MKMLIKTNVTVGFMLLIYCALGFSFNVLSAEAGQGADDANKSAIYYSNEHLSRQNARRKAQRKYRSTQKRLQGQTRIDRDIRRTITRDERKEIRQKVTPYVKQEAQSAAQNSARAVYKNNLPEVGGKYKSSAQELSRESAKRNAQSIVRQRKNATRDFTRVNSNLRRTLSKNKRKALRQEVGGDLSREVQKSAVSSARSQYRYDKKTLDASQERDRQPVIEIQSLQPDASGEPKRIAEDVEEVDQEILKARQLAQEQEDVLKEIFSKDSGVQEDKRTIDKGLLKGAPEPRRDLITDVIQDIR